MFTAVDDDDDSGSGSGSESDNEPVDGDVQAFTLDQYYGFSGSGGGGEKEVVSGGNEGVLLFEAMRGGLETADSCLRLLDLASSGSGFDLASSGSDFDLASPRSDCGGPGVASADGALEASSEAAPANALAEDSEASLRAEGWSTVDVGGGQVCAGRRRGLRGVCAGGFSDFISRGRAFHYCH